MVEAKKEVKKAFLNKYAIGSFNICNLETFQAVFNASKETNSPVFLSTSNTSIDYMGLENIKNLAEGLKRTKVILHLDHGSYKNAVACINKGYDSVMFDASRLSLKKNIMLTKKVVDYAHENNVIVEGEVGVLEKDGLTNPGEAEDFAEQTGVDLLAVSVGNLHGYYKYMPVLDFKRLLEIKQVVKTPLVLHGASGLNDETIKTAIRHGIVKINIDTELRWAFTKSVRDFLRRNSMNKFNNKSFDIRNYLGEARKSFERKVVDKIRLFQS
ncbi:MAG: class II fructose-bisphosphate aldolase [Nanoarchaeota archaeon]|nr:class II fructose-bisphosphate aldolase [Nanoarchaeota archaeon]